MTMFIHGAIMISFCVVALIFLRFWRRTHDRLFLIFSVAFLVLAVNRVFLAIIIENRPQPNEHHIVLYIVRLIAFLLILLAILDKNRHRPTSVPPLRNEPLPPA